MSNDESPPAYNAIPVLYDETHHGKHYNQPRMESMANLANLMGHLPKHADTTDGSFSICMAGGNCTLVSKNLYESIPEEHRPALNASHAREVGSLFGSMATIGSTIMPIVLENAETGQKFCIKLYALVVENLLMGMFIGNGGIDFLEEESWARAGITRVFNFGNGRKATVVYQPRRTG